MSVKEERMSNAGNKVCKRYGKTYSARRIKQEPMSLQNEDQYSCSLIKVEKDCEDDTDAVDTHNGYEYIVELEVKKEEPCETKEEQDTVSNPEHDGRESSSDSDVPVKDEIEIGPTVIQPQYIGSSLHTTDASKAELIQCGGADVTLGTTTPGAALYRGYSTRSIAEIHGSTSGQIKKENKGILKGNNKASAVFEQIAISCDVCQMIFRKQSSLLRHNVRFHTPCVCNICGYKCLARTSLMQHSRIHTADKQFSCNICEYKCDFKSILLRHMRRHNGEKPFSCYVCEFKFNQKSHLKRHMRVHAGRL